MPSYDPQQVALFRYQVIAPLISLAGPRGTLKREMERIAARSHDHPYLGPTHHSFATIEEWHYLYKREGLDGLLRPPRRLRLPQGAVRPGTQELDRGGVRPQDPLGIHDQERDAVEVQYQPAMGSVVEGSRAIASCYP